MAENLGVGGHLGARLRENGMLLALVAIVALFSLLVAMDGKVFLQSRRTLPTSSCRMAM